MYSVCIVKAILDIWKLLECFVSVFPYGSWFVILWDVSLSCSLILWSTFPVSLAPQAAQSGPVKTSVFNKGILLSVYKNAIGQIQCPSFS